jgi:DNA-binding CsgD family transcriptional regulator
LSGPGRTLPLNIQCLSLRTDEATLGGPAQAHALLVFHDLEDVPPIDLHILIAVFGLTRAEACVAGLLAEGQAPADIGLILDVSMGTIRTHLRVVASKLGVKRQSEMERLLTRLPQTWRG